MSDEYRRQKATETLDFLQQLIKQGYMITITYVELDKKVHLFASHPRNLKPTIRTHGASLEEAIREAGG